MWPIADLDDNNLRVATAYSGLLAFLIWNPMQTVFARKVREAYSAIHVSSGDSMVILAGRADWIPENERKAMLSDISKRQGSIGFALTLSGAGDLPFHKTLVALAEKFDVDPDDLPALVFVDNAEGKVAYVFKLPRELISSQDDRVENELLSVFQVVKSVVAADPCHVSAYEAESSAAKRNELEAWRAARLEYLVPVLEARSNWRFLKDKSGIISGGVRILAPFLGGK